MAAQPPQRLPRGEQQLFSYEELTYVESQLAENVPRFQMKGLEQRLYGVKNRCYKENEGESSEEETTEGPHRVNIVLFGDERQLEFAYAMNRSGAFLPLSVETIFRSRATITSHAAKEEMLASTLEWQMDPKFENLMNALWDRRINRVTKVIAFGLGSITARTRRREHQKEHALAMSIARSIRSRNPNNPIPIYVQDPDYNDVDKEVLAYFDFQVVEGHGAAGFAMVDPNTFVLAHNANFPVREIIADIVRPAAMYWKPTIPQAQHDENRAFAVHARDVDSVRTRQMMANYNHVPIQGSSLSRYPFYDFYDRCRGPWLRGEVFSNSTLYIRKSLPPPAKTPARRRRRAHSNLVGPGRRRRRNI